MLAGPLPLAKARLEGVRAVFADVDGTLTTDGRITSTVLGAIEWLVGHRVEVVLVSGRPSSWGECWIRQLPVAAVIVENGGMAWVRDGDHLEKHFAQTAAVRARNRVRLGRVVALAMKRVKGARLSTDSLGREVDLAIDHSEDGHVGVKGVDALEAILQAHGVTAVRSSVHVNCWIGDFDKRSAVAAFLREQWNEKLEATDPRYVYVGDSFNDAPMFEAFSLSVGVANVMDVIDRLDAAPKFVTRAREGRGFCELVDAIARAQKRGDKS